MSAPAWLRGTRDPTLLGPVAPHGLTGQLSQPQCLAIELLIQGVSNAEVAGRLGLHRGTVHRWRTQFHPFREELERQRRAVYEQSADRIRGAMVPAIELLEQQVRDAANSPDRAIRAAGMLLKLAAPRGLATPPAPEPPHPSHPPRPTPVRRRWTAAEDEAWLNAILGYADRSRGDAIRRRLRSAGRGAGAGRRGR